MPYTDPSVLGGRNLAAFLDMVGFSEGTDNGRQPTRDRGYDVLVGGGLFVSYADHPRILVELPRLGIKSTAAGRYQLLARYYDPYRRQLRLVDFGPAAQDAIAVQQIRERVPWPISRPAGWLRRSPSAKTSGRACPALATASTNRNSRHSARTTCSAAARR